MLRFNYAELKAVFVQSKDAFRDEFSLSKKLMRSVIKTLADAKYDNGWPLAMLGVLQPHLANALADWTAGGYEEIRQQQETNTVMPWSHAKRLERHFYLLPKWHGEAIHFSKDPAWFQRLRGGSLELKSFMGCCTPGHTFTYVNRPVATLIFTALRSGRLVGALTQESFEREVLLPKGTKCRVTSVDKQSGVIYLEER